MSTIDVAELVQRFGMDVDNCTRLNTPRLTTSTNVWRVERPDIKDNLFIVDTPEGREIACHPHIVGDELRVRAQACARASAETMLQHTTLLKGSHRVVVHHILRAAPGYELKPQLQEALRQRGHLEKLAYVSNRTKYVGSPSYRDHGTRRRIAITYRNYRQLPKAEEIILVIPDTFATLGSFRSSLLDLVAQCESQDTHINEAVLYGFVSIEACRRLNTFQEETGVPTAVFALEALTALATNGYDMPFYGYDETGEALGSITGASALRKLAPTYVPGLDTVGDWSARQRRFGEIEDHLRNTEVLLRGMLKDWKYENWQRRIAEDELTRIEKELNHIRT